MKQVNLIRVILALSVCVTGLAAAAELPLTKITLFTSGVGYFQRDAEIEGDATVELSFKTEQINDLLKSLILSDKGGGTISPVTYGSRDPITRALKSFAVDLTDNPSMDALLNQLRGVKAVVSAPQEMEGMILGVEKQQQQVKDEILTIRVLNLLTDAGMRSVPLTQVQQIRLLDAALDAELRKALTLLALSHDTQRKPVTLLFAGNGKRPVSVAYILETPVWKTSYRLCVEDDKFFLQGWGIVENTTDDDWKDVRLSLVSGRPISFIQDLYQPLYAARPVVQPELYASLTPRTYEGDMEERELAQGADANADKDRTASRRKASESMASGGLGFGGGGFGGAGIGGNKGFGGMPSNRGEEKMALKGEGVSSMARAAEVGELFQYTIDQPVNIARQKSAMIPIVNQDIEGEKVSIYNESVQAKFPLNGLRLKNTTKLNLMQGPITVFDAGTYAGDARIENVQPGEERLLSYAMDLSVEVDPQSGGGADELVSVKIVKGVLFADRKYRMEKTYVAKNKADRKKSLLVEHPLNSAWKLVEPEKPDERTPSVYRFKMSLPAMKTEKLLVREERQETQQVILLNTDLDAIALYLRAKVVSDKVKAALQKLVELKTGLNDLSRQRAALEQQLKEIDQEQGRLRANMGAVPQNSDLYGRYMKKLGDQENEIEKLRDQLKDLRAKEADQKKAVDEYLAGLEVE